MKKDAHLEKQVGNLLTMDSELAKKNEDLQKKVTAVMNKNVNLKSDIVSQFRKLLISKFEIHFLFI